jgi:WD40 repeat protein
MVFIRLAVFLNFLFLGNALLAQNQTPFLISPAGDSFYDFFVSKSNKLYFSDSRKLWVYDIKQKKTLKELAVNLKSPVTSVVADEEQQIVFLGTKSGNIGGFDLANGNMSRFNFHKGNRITSMVIDDKNKSLFVGMAKGEIFQHSTDNLEAFETIAKGKGEVTSLKINQSGEDLAASWSKGELILFNASTGIEICSTRVFDQYLRDLTFVNEQNRVLTVSHEGLLCKWRISNKKNLVLLDQEKVSGSWLLTIDTNDSGLSICYGGVNHSLIFQSPYGKNMIKYKGPVLKAHILEENMYVSFITCIYGMGIYFTNLNDMKSLSK